MPIRFVRLLCVFTVTALLAGFPLSPAQAQPADALAQQVTVDMHGADGVGKDGVLAPVGTRLAALYRQYEARQKSGRLTPVRPPSSAMVVSGEYVVIDAVAANSASALRADLEALGLRQGAQVGRLVSGRLPIEAIPAMARLSTMRSARPSLVATRAGAVTSRGDAVMRSDIARENLGVDGSGITVGVLSDSYDTNPSASTRASEDITTGDLPPSSRIRILEELGDEANESTGSDEGRAMMQIIHDVAPGVSQAFHTAFNGIGNFAQGIRDLANAGAHVIVDDVIYFAEPMFQDGPIAQAANEVARTQDAAYFTSAGNNGRNSYESAFRASGESGVLNAQGELHDFGGGDTGQRLIIPEGDSVRIALQWTDPYASLGGPGADSDLDIFITDQAGTVVARSDFDNIGTDPFEFLEFANDGSIDADNDGTPDTQFELGIELFEGPPPDLFKYVYFPSSGVEIDEFAAQSQRPTLYGHANAEEAMAVGAVFWFATPAFDDQFTNPFEINGFSSRGGVPIYFTPEGTPLATPETRNKPDMVGPDGTNTTFFGQELNDGPDGDSGDGFPNFFGTSAAAPHVAAVAALMLEFDPGRAPAQVYDDLKSTAIDMDDPATPAFDEGFDFATGFGLVQADEAVPLAAEVVQFSAAEASGGNTIAVSWRETSTAQVDEYVLERQYFDGSFEEIATVASDGNPPQDFAVETENLGLGQYTFRLHWRRPDGTTDTSPQQPTVTIGLQDFSASITGDEEDDVQLAWSVPAATSGYTYTVQLRTQEAFDDARSTTDRSLTVTNLQPGRYDFRLRMEDTAGNVLFSDIITEQVPLDGAVAITNAYPNPTSGPVNLTLTTERQQVIELRMYDAAGQLVQIEFRQLDALVPTPITLDLRNQGSGKYFVQVIGDDFTESRSVVRVR